MYIIYRACRDPASRWSPPPPSSPRQSCTPRTYSNNNDNIILHLFGQTCPLLLLLLLPIFLHATATDTESRRGYLTGKSFRESQPTTAESLARYATCVCVRIFFYSYYFLFFFTGLTFMIYDRERTRDRTSSNRSVGGGGTPFRPRQWDVVSRSFL